MTRHDTWDEAVEEAKTLNQLELCYGCVEDINPDTCGTAELGGRYEVYMCDDCCMESFADIMDSFARLTNDQSVEWLQERLTPDS